MEKIDSHIIAFLFGAVLTAGVFSVFLFGEHIGMSGISIVLERFI